MNIAIIVPSLKGGGAERTAANLSTLLADEYNVYIFVFDTSNIVYRYKGTIIDVSIPASNNWMSRFFNVIKRTKRINEYKRKLKIDVSISFMKGANFVNCIQNQNCKIITSVRTYMSKSESNNVLKRFVSIRIQRFIMKKSDFVVTLSKGVKNDLINYYRGNPQKIVTIYNPYEEKLYYTANSDDYIIPYSVATMGRLIKVKGQWHLIRAFKYIKQKYPEATLNIYGEGELKDELESLVEKLDVKDSVTFHGFVNEPHYELIKNEVFVFSSLYEGLGYALLEALGCGMACVSTDCMSGPREILGPNTTYKGSLQNYELAQYGILTSVLDEEHFEAESKLTLEEKQLAEAICFLFDNKEKMAEYRKKTQERIKDFSANTIKRDWKKLIMTK